MNSAEVENVKFPMITEAARSQFLPVVWLIDIGDSFFLKSMCISRIVLCSRNCNKLSRKTKLLTRYLFVSFRFHASKKFFSASKYLFFTLFNFRAKRRQQSGRHIFITCVFLRCSKKWVYLLCYPMPCQKPFACPFFMLLAFKRSPSTGC